MSESPAHRAFREAVIHGRTSRGLSQRELVERLADLGVSMYQSGLAKIEKGDREPKIDEVVAIATVLGFSLDSLSGSGPSADALIDVTRSKLKTAQTATAEVVDSYVQAVEARAREAGTLSGSGYVQAYVTRALIGKRGTISDVLDTLADCEDAESRVHDAVVNVLVPKASETRVRTARDAANA